MFKISFSKLLFILLAFFCSGCEAEKSETAPQTIKFTTLDKYNQSGIQKPRFVIVKDSGTWQSLWQEHRRNRPGMPIPAIDFAETMVLGVFLGMRPNTCYSVSLESVEQIAGQRLNVNYRETKPAAGSICGQALTFPSHLISVPAIDLPVEFVAQQ